MRRVQEFTVQVNGKHITATVCVDAPGLETEDCLSFQMILAALASGQPTSYHSRHHLDRVATVRPGRGQGCTERPAHLRILGLPARRAA